MKFWKHMALMLTTGLALGLNTAQAQTKNTILSHNIVIAHDRVNASTGKAEHIATWNWLDYARYYDLLTKQQIQPLVPYNKIASIKPQGDVYTITQTNAEGDLERRMIVTDGTVSSTIITAIPSYKYDVNDILPQLLKDQTILTAQTDKDGPALIRVTMLNTNNKHNVTWLIRDPSYVDKLVRSLKKSPQVDEKDWDNLPNFVGTGAIRLEAQTGKIDGLPNFITIEDHYIRATTNTTRTLVYFDRLGIGTEAEGQKKLEDFYKNRGLRPIRKY
jgi:hypothetical protein